MTDKFYEKTRATERKYTGKIISEGTLFDAKTLSAWLMYKLLIKRGRELS